MGGSQSPQSSITAKAARAVNPPVSFGLPAIWNFVLLDAHSMMESYQSSETERCIHALLISERHIAAMASISIMKSASYSFDTSTSVTAGAAGGVTEAKKRFRAAR